MSENDGFESKYLELRELERKPKTIVYGLFSKQHGDKLGEIKWFARWRQYTFFPEKDTIWNRTCLLDVIHFLSKAMVEGRL
jgi:hypothetical protein